MALEGEIYNASGNAQLSARKEYKFWVPRFITAVINRETRLCIMQNDLLLWEQEVVLYRVY